MRDGYFEVKKEGTLLMVKVVKDLTIHNAPALLDEISKYAGQGIEKVIFDATGLFYITSAGLRVVFYAYQKLGSHPDIEFVNCPKEIRTVLDHVGLTSVVNFVESDEVEKDFRRNMDDVGDKVLEERIRLRRETLDNFAAHNDVVCETMRLGQEE